MNMDRTLATGGDGKNAESTVSFDRGSFVDMDIKASQKGGSVERIDSSINLLQTQLTSGASKFRVSQITSNSKKALMQNNNETIDIYDHWKRNPNTILANRTGSIGKK